MSEKEIDHICINILSWKDDVDVKKSLMEICQKCHYVFAATLCIHTVLDDKSNTVYVNPFEDITREEVYNFGNLLDTFTNAYSIIIRSGENKYAMYKVH